VLESEKIASDLFIPPLRPCVIFSLAASAERVAATTRASGKRAVVSDLWTRVLHDLESEAAHRKTLRHASSKRRRQEKIRRSKKLAEFK
jgi:hypothetical protein